MAVLPIKVYGNPVLRQKAAPIEEIDAGVVALVRDMFDTLRKASGLGLAANQVGVARRVFVVDLSKIITGSKPFALINPVLSDREGEQVSEEGCLSIPGIYADVLRHKTLKYKALDLSGEEINGVATDLLARVLQHELDHLDGILFTDHLSLVVQESLAGQLKKLSTLSSREAFVPEAL